MKMINVRVKDKKAIAVHKDVVAACTKAEAALADNGRVLLRPSGTEPVVRVMVEAKSHAMVKEHVEALAAVVKKAGSE